MLQKCENHYVGLLNKYCFGSGEEKLQTNLIAILIFVQWKMEDVFHCGDYHSTDKKGMEM